MFTNSIFWLLSGSVRNPAETLGWRARRCRYHSVATVAHAAAAATAAKVAAIVIPVSAGNMRSRFYAVALRDRGIRHGRR